MMNFYEEEMRIFMQSDKMLAKRVFCDKTVTGSLSGTTNAKITFHNFGCADHYYGFSVSIIDKRHGVVDTQNFRFSDIVGKQENEKSFHIWEYQGKAQWSGIAPTDAQRQDIISVIQSYLMLYV